MAGQEKKRNPRSAALILDLLHIVIGILVVICAILAFLDPEGNSILFPVIFWLAALLNGIVGGFRLKMSGHDKKKQAGGNRQTVMFPGRSSVSVSGYPAPRCGR